jgi:AraC-like DNA-binding protein
MKKILKRKPKLPFSTQQPTIVKYSLSQRQGVQSDTIHRHAIGFVLQGKRRIYYGDVLLEIDKGSIYYLRAGTHYIQDVPEGNKPFEQIVFYYDTFQINKILNHLNINYHLPIEHSHECPNCSNRSEVAYPCWNALKQFFRSVDVYLDESVFGNDNAAENIKMTELVYLLLANEDCCLKRCILDNMDTSLAGFEQIIHENIFNDLTIDELAAMTNRSPTSFKKDFKKHFNESPHQWFIRQRLMHAHLQLISTNRSIADIGTECAFPNTSHFIKLFKKQYELTPVAYRRAHEKIKMT